MTLIARARSSAAGALLILLSACSSVPDNARIGIAEPDRTQFDPVGSYLDHRCGSLDCHGSPQRNLVLWGCEGLRLDPKDVPGCARMGGKDTTEPEFDASFRSLVGLEPTVMNQVIAGKGQHPELLTFVRKARGEEAHKGGALIIPGDAQDTCIVSWLAGATDTASCTQALQKTP
jgi:hypothetical protein